MLLGKKLKRVRTALTLSILLTAQIGATEEIILKKGEKAPYYGVFMDEDRYRWYQREVDVTARMQEEWMACEMNACEDEHFDSGSFIWGAVFGSMAYFLIHVAND